VLPDRTGERVAVDRRASEDLQRFSDYWSPPNVRLWFKNNKKMEELAEAAARGDRQSAAHMKVMLLTRQVEEAWRRERRNGRELAEVVAKYEALGNANALLQEQLRTSEETAAMLLRENTLLKAELAETRTIIIDILEGKPDDARPLRGSLPAVDNQHVTRFLEEWLRLAGQSGSQRRYSEAMYELAFILHRTSPA
jgi:hypothetical protein